LPSTSCFPDRPKHESRQLKIIATFAEANVRRPHSGTLRLIVINQGEDSVAPVGDSEEDVYYRNDSAELVSDAKVEVERSVGHTYEVSSNLMKEERGGERAVLYSRFCGCTGPSLNRD
jgi:hypothetical protein